MAETGRRNDYGKVWVAASVAGSLATALFGPLALAQRPEDILPGLAAGTFFLIFIAPVWMIGIATVGLVSLRLLELMRLDTRGFSIAVGAVIVGAIWFAFGYEVALTDPVVARLLAAGKPALVGALAGGIAGYAGWRFGRVANSAPNS